MARPKKKGLDFFSFDVDFFDDDKVLVIEAEFGPKGVLAIIVAFALVYKTGYYLDWNEITRAKMLRKIRGLSTDTFEMIIRKSAKLGLFDENLFRSEGVLTSRGIQTRYFMAAKFRKLNADMPYLLILPDNYAGGGGDEDEKRDSKSKTGVPQRLTPVSQEITSVSPTENPPSAHRARREPKFLAREDFLNKFFVKANEPGIRSVCNELHISMEQFIDYAKIIINEWQLAQKYHYNYSDAAANLISHVRCKAAYANEQQPSSSPRLNVTRGDIEAAEARKRRDDIRRQESQREPSSANEPLRGEALNEWFKSKGLEPGDIGGSLQRQVALEKEGAEASAIADLRARLEVE